MKIDDALVAAITRELLRRLGSGGDLSPVEKKPLVIAGGVSILQDAARRGLEAGYDIRYHDGLETLFPDNAGVLITKLSIQALTRLAEGDAGCTPEGAALLWALLRGKRPVVLEEGIEWRAFRETMSPALSSRLNAHERTLASYGVVFVREADVLCALAGGSSAGCSGFVAASGKTSPAPVSVPPAGAKKRVISEIELTRLCPEACGFNQTLEIGSKDILTPLANDYVEKMRIIVNRSK